MKQVVYVDILFAVNLIINYFILLAVAGVLKRRDKRYRLLGGAFLGAVYSLFIFFPQVGFLYSFACKMIASVLIVRLSYRWTSLRDFIRLLLAFYLVSCLLGGALFALWYFLSPPGLLMRNGVAYVDIPPVQLILFTAVFYIITVLVSRIFHSAGGTTYEVEIRCGSAAVRLTALLDTGNGLTDVVTGVPVVVAEYRSVEKLIPVSDRAAFRGGNIERSETAWASRTRLIPYGSVSGKTEMLPAFRPDRLSIWEKRGARRDTSDVLVAVCARQLSDDGRYQALLHPALVGK